MDKKDSVLGTENISKLMLRLSIPSIIAQIVSILYNIIDRIFIGRMVNGEIAMAGVGISFPIIVLISAFSGLVGMGGAPLAAIKMGNKDNDGAENILSNSLSILIILSTVLTLIFLIFGKQILLLFGASERTLSYGLSYINIYVLGTIFVQISIGMNPYINTQGFSTIGMITVGIGAIINIALDPIFIFKFNLGVRGAALATIISQAISALWVLKFLLGDRTILKIRKEYMKLKKDIVLPIISLGISPFIMQSTESLVLISLNSQLVKYGGDIAVSAMTIMSSAMQMLTLPIYGFAQGAQPIISYNYGAKNIKRVVESIKLCIMLCFTYSVLAWIILVFHSEIIVELFNKDPKLLSITVKSMHIYFATIFVLSIQIGCQRTFLALGQSKISLVLALLRKVILLVPLIFILPMFITDGLFAVLLAEPVSDVIASISTLICFIFFYKNHLIKIEDTKKTI